MSQALPMALSQESAPASRKRRRSEEEDELTPASSLPDAMSEGESQGCAQRTFDINDAPAHLRAALAESLGGWQEEAERRFGVILSVKGRYLAPHETPREGDGPLRLQITPAKHLPMTARKAALERCAREVQRVLSAAVAVTHSAGPPRGSRSEVVGVVDVNVPFPDPRFKFSEKLKGPDNSYLGHIERATGAHVQVRGIGSGVWTGSAQADARQLHVRVTAQTAKAMSDARSLAASLVTTTRKQYSAWLLGASQMPPNCPLLAAARADPTAPSLTRQGTSYLSRPRGFGRSGGARARQPGRASEGRRMCHSA